MKRKDEAKNIEDMAINIILDESEPPYPLFVEIENDSGEQIGIGTREPDGSGLTKLRICISDILNNEGMERDKYKLRAHLQARVKELEADLNRTVNAIHQYMQTTEQQGKKETMVENFVGMYTYAEGGN